jgi:hypothetical protein
VAAVMTITPEQIEREKKRPAVPSLAARRILSQDEG